MWRGNFPPVTGLPPELWGKGATREKKVKGQAGGWLRHKLLLVCSPSPERNIVSDWRNQHLTMITSATVLPGWHDETVHPHRQEDKQ